MNKGTYKTIRVSIENFDKLEHISNYFDKTSNETISDYIKSEYKRVKKLEQYQTKKTYK